MNGRARTTLQPDLDIFGDSTGTDDTIDVEDTDIFGISDDATEGGEDTSSETTEEKSDTTEESTSEATESDESKKDEVTPEETPVDLETPKQKESEETEIASTEGDEDDFDLDKLFDEIEDEAKDEGNKELMNMLDDLRRKVAERDSELALLRKQNEVINEKLMNRAGEDVEMGMYKPLIDNIEGDRNLKFFVANYGKLDNPKVKDRLVDVVSGFVKELTGQDIGEMFDKDQTDKLIAVSGSSSSSAPLNDGKKEEKAMTYEDSINNLF